MKQLKDVLMIAGVVIGLMMPGQMVFAHSEDSELISRDSNAYGNTYGEWSARWIQWLLSIPTATNPAVDTTGANCGQGQAGPVWFLAGTFGGPAKRACTVPASKALFFALTDGFFGAGAGDCVPTGTVPCNLAALREAASASTDSVILAVSVDGKSLSDLTDQRVQPPVMTVTYPDGNLVGVQSGTYSPNVADGYWVMLSPLSAGRHTISFSAQITGGVFNGTSIGPVTYKLTILP